MSLHPSTLNPREKNAVNSLGQINYVPDDQKTSRWDFGVSSEFALCLSSLEGQEKKEEKIHKCTKHITVYMQFAQCVRSTRRCVVIYALRRNLTLVPSPQPSNLALHPFPPPLFLFLSLFLLPSPLAHATKFLFDVKQPNRRLSHCPPSPPLSLSPFLVFSLLHTRLLHLCHCGRWSFWISTYPHRGKKNRGRKKEKRTPIDSSSWLKRGTAATVVRKKEPRKKGPARSRVFRRAINWSASLCSSCCEKERGCSPRSGQRWLQGYPRCVYPSFHPSPSGSYSRRWTSDDARGEDDELEDAREDGH